MMYKMFIAIWKMSNMKELNKINNELKGYVNEANFISNKCRNKIIKILGEEFGIEFVLDNYANVDVKILEDGSIEMRGDKYKTPHKINDLSDIEERYNNFKVKADKILKKKNSNKNSKKDIDNIINLFVILGILIIFLFVIFILLNSFLSGDYYHMLWLMVFILPLFVPKLKDNLIARIEQARNYLKRRFKK